MWEPAERVMLLVLRVSQGEDQQEVRRKVHTDTEKKDLQKSGWGAPWLCARPTSTLGLILHHMSGFSIA